MPAVGAQRPPAATLLIINEEINCAERCLTREQPCDIALPSPFTPGAKLSSRPCRGGPGVSRQRTFHLDFGGKVRQAGRGAGARAGWGPHAPVCPPRRALGAGLSLWGTPRCAPSSGRVRMPMPSGASGDAYAAGTGSDRAVPGPSRCLVPPSFGIPNPRAGAGVSIGGLRERQSKAGWL